MFAFLQRMSHNHQTIIYDLHSTIHIFKHSKVKYEINNQENVFSYNANEGDG